MKGILLAGGSGSRLYPLTSTVSKQLLPIYNKPTIYYPLSALMLAEIREVLVISTPRDLPLIRGLLGDGSRIGMSFSYAEQAEPKGIAQALQIGADFLAGSPVCLILGDNFFYGAHLERDLLTSAALREGAEIYAYHVQDPERYGVVELDKNGHPLGIEEKPLHPRSPLAITGLYFYDQNAPAMAAGLKPSARGELEISDINRLYLEKGLLRVRTFGRGAAWLDTGTFDSLAASSHFVQTIEQRTGLMIACLEEIAYRKNFISREQLRECALSLYSSSYGQYLLQLSEKAAQDENP
jgi:glucose-1-phosphate thymidylyltransferase